MSRQLGLKLAALWLIFGGLNGETAWALSSDKEQPIHIEADRGELDDRKHIAVYRGNVHLTQGTLRIDSDTLTIYYTSEKKLEKAIAEGQPAWYRQRPDNSDEDIRAKALRMEYHANTATIYLLHKAHVWQGANEFTGDRIVYETEHDIVRGEGSKTGNGRVHVTIRPDNNSTPVGGPIPEKATLTSENTSENQEDDNRELSPELAHGRTTTWLNLRTGPDTDHNKTALLPPRTPVTILERQEEWLHITALAKGESIEGWVHADFIRLLDGRGE